MMTFAHGNLKINMNIYGKYSYKWVTYFPKKEQYFPYDNSSLSLPVYVNYHAGTQNFKFYSK